jgi:hypothetical protein
MCEDVAEGCGSVRDTASSPAAQSGKGRAGIVTLHGPGTGRLITAGTQRVDCIKLLQLAYGDST